MNVGERTGDYEIVAILGAGGMGQVYKVRNILSDRIEALKVLHPGLDGDPDLAERFLREIKTQASLDHPNIAKLNTATQSGNQVLMVMEFVEGTTLDALIAQGELSPGLAIDYTSQVLDALAYAHGRGVIHRDIKPANMMIMPAGQVKLMDFGISRFKEDNRLTKTGGAVGSLHYMAPEQVRGAAVDQRADIYSLGVTLYQMVTGRRPFVGDSDYQLMTAQLMQTPPAPIEITPSVPADLSDIILMAIDKDADRRFQTAAAFKGALGSVQLAATPMPVGVSAPPVGLSTKTLHPAVSAPEISLPVPMPAPAIPRVMPPPMPQQDLPYPPNTGGNSSRRGLYMGLGSLATIAVLVAALIYGPKMFTSKADTVKPTIAAVVTPTPVVPEQTPVPNASDSPAVTETKVAPTPEPVTEPKPVTASRPRMTPTQIVAPSMVSATKLASHGNPSAKGTVEIAQAQIPAGAPAMASPSSPAAAPPMSKELNEVRERFNNDSVRAAALKDEINTFAQRLASQGMAMRGDAREAETRTQYNLNEAMQYIRKGDVEQAKQSLQYAEGAMAQIAKALGR